MKTIPKILLALALSLSLAPMLRADILFTESFAYNDGAIIQTGTNANGSTNWFRHSGSASPSDAIVKNHKLQNSATGGSVTRQDDVHRNFTSFTNAANVVFASFTVNCTNLPTVTSYFAHFYASSTTFHARVFATPGVASNSWRVGITGAGATPKVYQADLAPNQDYQVVVQWDPVSLLAATIWVNPVSSSDYSVTSNDAVTPPVAAAIGYGFRQASSAGSLFLSISNLVCATTFDEAATNVWSLTPVAPTIAVNPKAHTNFVSDLTTLSVLADGQGQAGLTYSWRKDGSPISNPDGNTNVLAFLSAAVADSGNYDVVVTTPLGISSTSAAAFLWITNAPVPPTITQQPASSTNYVGQNVTLHTIAVGPPPISYQWFYNNGSLPPTAIDDGAGNLTISGLGTTNGTAGIYRCDVSNPYGTTPSSNANVAVIAPPTVSIAYLRSLVDPVNYVIDSATTGKLRFTATGTVTTYTNLTTGTTSSYYIQDSTGGINIFVTGTQGFRPQSGDQVMFVGLLSSFSSSLELYADVNDPTTSYSVVATNLPLPAAKVIPMTITNSLALSEATEGSVVMLTNVTFAAGGTVIPSAANLTAVVTDASGSTFNLVFVTIDLDLVGQTLPSFAYTVRGVLTQNLSNTATPRNSGYQINITRFSDIVTNPPPAVTVAAAKVAGKTALTWDAVPYDYSYSVYASSTVDGAYLPLATGLTFTGTAGSFTDTNAVSSAKFYKIVSP